jgi:hypothetical protein
MQQGTEGRRGRPEGDPAVEKVREAEGTLDVDLGGEEDGMPGGEHGGSPPPPPREHGQDRASE